MFWTNLTSSSLQAVKGLCWLQAVSRCWLVSVSADATVQAPWLCPLSVSHSKWGLYGAFVSACWVLNS
jgi:hypothetical protein